MIYFIMQESFQFITDSFIYLLPWVIRRESSCHVVSRPQEGHEWLLWMLLSVRMALWDLNVEVLRRTAWSLGV